METTSRQPQSETGVTAAAVDSRSHPPLLLYGALIGLVGLGIYLFGVVLAFVRIFADPGGYLASFNAALVWYSGMPVIVAIFLAAIDLFVLLPRKRQDRQVMMAPVANQKVTVVLTAYNDELSIGEAVQDFTSHPAVKRVIVIDNNSKDRTSEVARQAGAIVVLEHRQGYGNCVYRAFEEAVSYEDTDLTLLCEGDMTFRAFDIDKFLAYIAHAEIVNGTRIVEQLRAEHTQLTTFMFYGNFFVGKLLEIKHIGLGTFTDVGTTYKLCRNSALKRLLPHLDRNVNLEFNAHFLDTALGRRFRMVECPITFFERVGVSKGGNVNDMRALKVGTRMIAGILFGWKPLVQQ